MRFLLCLALMASTSYGGDIQLGDSWSGLRVHVASVVQAVSGKASSCPPGDRLVRDLLQYTDGIDWRLSVSEYRADGEPNDIVLLDTKCKEDCPLIEVVKNGQTVKEFVGYRGDIEKEVILKFPGRLKRTSKPIQSVRSVQRTTIYVAATPKPIRVSGPTWTWPGDLRSHLAAEHGYSMAWLNTLPTSELVLLHDNAHNSTRPTAVRPTFVQTLPRRSYAAAPAYNAQSYSMGVLGVPLFNQRWSSSYCPGGVCP